MRSDTKINQVINQINRLLQEWHETNSFYVISNNAIHNTILLKYGFHLTHEGISKLSDNFPEYLTSSFITK